MFKLALHILKILVYVVMVAGVLGFTMMLLALMLYIVLESVLSGMKGYFAYKWIALFSVSIPLCIVWLLNKKRNSLKKYADEDGMLIWDVSWNIVAISLSFFFLSICWASIKNFTRQDKDPRIDSINEVLENVDKVEGKTITISPQLFDTAAISAEVRSIIRNGSFIWTPFVSEEEGFSVEYPNYSILKKDEFIGTHSGRYHMKTYYTDTDRRVDFNNLYSVSVVSIPDDYSVLSFLDVVKEYLLRENYGELISYGDYKGIGLIGKEMLISTKNGDEVLTVRIVAKKARIFVISVTTDKENADNEYLKYFFNSVQLL